METFSKGRDFAAWVGLTPRQHSSGGKDRLGRTSKMGQRDIRRLLIVGAVAVVRWAARKGAPDGSWLSRMLARKPKYRCVIVDLEINKLVPGVVAEKMKADIRMRIGPGDHADISLGCDLVELTQIFVRAV